MEFHLTCPSAGFPLKKHIKKTPKHNQNCLYKRNLSEARGKIKCKIARGSLALPDTAWKSSVLRTRLLLKLLLHAFLVCREKKSTASIPTPKPLSAALLTAGFLRSVWVNQYTESVRTICLAPDKGKEKLGPHPATAEPAWRGTPVATHRFSWYSRSRGMGAPIQPPTLTSTKPSNALFPTKTALFLLLLGFFIPI